MGLTKIEWVQGPDSSPGYTWNPWLGCTKISHGCKHCFAESWAKRSGQPHLWRGTRRRVSIAGQRAPLLWNVDARKSGIRRKVFASSLADVFDAEVDQSWRDDMWDVVAECDDLDFLVLTKRPDNIPRMLPTHRPSKPWPWPNVWLGTSAEDPETALFRLPHLGAVEAVVRFVSAEPLLQDWSHLVPQAAREWGIDWIIWGAESGPRARDVPDDLARSMRDACKTTGTAFFMKQLPKRRPIPADLLVREFPTPILARAA